MPEMQKIGRYEVKGEIGRGGMASVVKAYDPRFERDVAIKLLPAEFLHDPQFRARFEREAKTIAMLEHPAIVPVYDFGEEQGVPYIVMRYMSGGSLSDRIIRGPAPNKEVMDFFNRLAPALDAAHSHGVIHRDLKPGNILYDQYGNSFLSDFGIARISQNPSAATLTGGNILGTPAYMSPEQVQGDKEIDGRSDLYAMGVILYQLLTGSAPYQATTPARVMMMHILEPVPVLAKSRPDLPPQVQQVLNKCMAKDPNDRYATCADMAHALEDAFKGIGLTPDSAPDAPVDKTVITSKKAGSAAAAGTIVAAGRTVVAPGKTVIPAGGGAAPTQVQPSAAAARPAKAGVPIWLIAVAAIVILAVLGGVVVLGGKLLVGQTAPPTATTLPTTANQAKATLTQAAALLPTHTSAPSPTTEPSSTPAASPTAKPSPTAAFTDTPAPSPTSTSAPQALVIGGADKIAFIEKNNVWAANLDGTDLVQLTTDGSTKTSLQWLPDGKKLVFITGKCIKLVDYPSGRQELITCFNSAAYLNDFQVSPDGKQVAISLDNEQLYVVPFNVEKLKTAQLRRDLVPMGTCKTLAPYDSVLIKSVRWGADGKKLAFVFAAPIGGRREDTIRVIDISTCYDIFPRIGVEFPNNWFSIKGWDKNPSIPSFGWNGNELFALNGLIRNGGFGDLYIFNNGLTRVQNEANPINNSCCYRDVQFSPDGSYLVFAYQAVSTENKIQLYIIPVGTIGTGETYTPIPLPDTMFAARDASPQPVLRKAQP